MWFDKKIKYCFVPIPVLNNSFVRATEENYTLRKDIQEEEFQADLADFTFLSTIKTINMVSANLLMGIGQKIIKLQTIKLEKIREKTLFTPD